MNRVEKMGDGGISCLPVTKSALETRRKREELIRHENACPLSTDTAETTRVIDLPAILNDAAHNDLLL